MNKITLLIVAMLASPVGYAADPDESGIGGTGVSKPEVGDFIFNRPDIPEIIDVPDAPDTDDISPADLTDMPSATETNIGGGSVDIPAPPADK